MSRSEKAAAIAAAAAADNTTDRAIVDGAIAKIREAKMKKAATEKAAAIVTPEKATKATKAPKATHETLSESVAATWLDPAVRAARSERNGVKVDGVQFLSVGEAFRKLGLPMGVHISFRGKLKAAGKLEAYDKKWEITDRVVKAAAPQAKKAEAAAPQAAAPQAKKAKKAEAAAFEAALE
jgi:hypothetical protein